MGYYEMAVTSALLGSIVTILVIALYKRLKRPKIPSFSFNPEVLTGFDTWLGRSISLYMVRYIEDKAGRELLKDDELAIDSQFGSEGIEYVSRMILSNIPNFYQGYMIRFYGRDKFVNAIYDKVRAVFIEYINNQRRSRLNRVMPINNLASVQDSTDAS